MRVEIKLEDDCEQPRVVIYAKELTPDVQALAQRLTDLEPGRLVGYQDDQLYLLQPAEVLRVYAEQQRVFAQTEEAVYTLRLRLYEVEERLRGAHFLRVSNSELVNFQKVRSLDLSYSGTICIRLNGGVVSYVSRRYVSKIKQYLGI